MDTCLYQCVCVCVCVSLCVCVYIRFVSFIKAYAILWNVNDFYEGKIKSSTICRCCELVLVDMTLFLCAVIYLFHRIKQCYCYG